MKYKDDKGYTYSARHGLGDAGWFVMKSKNGVGWHRVKSPALPERENESEAQADLDAWAEKKGLKAAESQELKEEIPVEPESTGRSCSFADPENWKVEMIPVMAIRPSPVNPRTFHEGDASIGELAKSIKSNGMLQPITVRPVDCPGDISYELICGERRWRAYTHLKWNLIPAHVMELDDQAAYEFTALENLQREDLSPIEEANGIAVLLKGGKSIEEIADKLGKPVGWVARRAKLRDLTPKWQAAIGDTKNGFSYWPVTHLELVARHASAVQDEIYALYNPHYIQPVSLADLRKELGRFMLTLSSAPWPKDVEWPDLKNRTSCNQCTMRSSYQPLLFDDIPGVKKNDRCLDRSCYAFRLEVYVLEKEKELRQAHGDILLFNRAKWQERMISDKSPIRNREISETWRYEKTKEGTARAVPALITDGPNAGSIEWWRLKDEYSDRASQNQQFDADGNTLPKPLSVRRVALAKRREMNLLERTHAIIEEEEEKKERCADLTTEQMVVAAVMYPTEGVSYKEGKGGRQHLLSEQERREAILKDYRPETGATIRVAVKDLYVQVLNTWKGMVKHASIYGDTSSGWPEFIYELFGLDIDAARREIEAEIPVPKAWAGLNEDGTPKKGAKGAA